MSLDECETIENSQQKQAALTHTHSPHCAAAANFKHIRTTRTLTRFFPFLLYPSIPPQLNYYLITHYNCPSLWSLFALTMTIAPPILPSWPMTVIDPALFGIDLRLLNWSNKPMSMIEKVIVSLFFLSNATQVYLTCLLHTYEGGLLSVNNQKNVQFGRGGGGQQQLWQPKALSDGSKRRQAKMLLVSLIESFCRVYGESPESNRKVFFLICQTLRSLGLIDAEFMDEMASVRSTFQNAFQQLFYTAVQTVQDERLFQQHQKMIGPVPSSDEEEGSSSMRRFQTPTPTPSAAAAATTPSTITSEQLLSNLSVQNSRYENDFVEISMLGRGGFASVWRARNKLDGIDYAIKKIRLGKDLDTMMDHENPYEKIFREIKHLARLEHRNVVRYYSSWLELVSSAALQRDEEEDEDYFSEYYRSSTTTTTTRKSKVRFHQETSMFNDPIFDFSDESSLRMNSPQLSSPGVDFVMEEEETEEEEEEKMTLTSNSGSSMMKVQRSSSIQRRHHSAFGSFEGEWVLYIQMQLCPGT